MPTEFMGRALQRQRDAVQRHVLSELQAIRDRLPALRPCGLTSDAAAMARIDQLEQQIGVLAGVVMELCRSTMPQAAAPAMAQSAWPAAPRLVDRRAVFTCPACLADIARQQHLAGQRGRCPHCGSGITHPW